MHVYRGNARKECASMSNRTRVARAGGGLACSLAAGAFAQQPSQSPFSPTNIFAPVSTPADSILGLSIFVLGVTAVIFVVVFGLLVYSVLKYRRRDGDDTLEPPQIYGSNQVDLAWT